MPTIYLSKDLIEYATPEMHTASEPEITIDDINTKLDELTSLCQSNTNRILRVDNLLRNVICLLHSDTED